MTEKSLRKFIRNILLEDEMGKFLVRGLQRAQALEKGEEFSDTSLNKKGDGVLDKKNLSEIVRDEILSKEIIKDFNRTKVPDSFYNSLKTKVDLKNFFINAKKFLSNKKDYDFLKNKIKSADLEKLKNELQDNESKKYFSKILTSLNKISNASLKISSGDLEMKEIDYLQNLSLKRIVSENLSEIDFSKLRSKISNFFSKKSSPQNSQQQTQPQQSQKQTSQSMFTSGSGEIEPIKYEEFKKIKTLPFGNQSVPSNMVSPFLAELFFVKEDGVIKVKKNSAITWMMKSNVSFELTDKLTMRSGYDKNKIKPTDIIFKGNWKSGDFKGVFADGYFLGGYFNGGIYQAPSLNFMPGKKYTDKLNAFKNGKWLSMDGLLGFPYIKFPTKSDNLFSLEMPINSYAIFETNVGKYKVKILKQPKGQEMKFVYAVYKFHEKNKRYYSGIIVEGSYEDIRNSPQKFLFSKGNGKVLFWDKQNKYPELNQPIDIISVNFGR